MTHLTAVLAIMGALLVGAISPGPSFVVVARSAIAQSRRHGISAALGMGAGGIVFSALALAGLYTLLASVGWLYTALKIAGGLYLLYIAVHIWRGASGELGIDTAVAARSSRVGASFWTGLSTQLSNPKTAIVYGSIFAALLPRDVPLWGYFVLPPAVFVVEAGWYSAVALAFSHRRSRGLYTRARKWIDRGAAAIIGVLGVRLVVTAPQAGI